MRPMTRSVVAPTGLTGRQVGLAAALLLAIGTALVSLPKTIGGYGDAGLSGVLFSVLGPVCYTAVGVVILWRRPGQGVGRLALTIGLLFTASSIVVNILLATTPPGFSYPAISWLPRIVVDVARALTDQVPVFGLILGGILLIIWFPDGHPTTRLGLLAEIGLLLAMTGIVVDAARDPVVQVIGWSPVLLAVVDVVSSVGGFCIFAAYALAVVDLVRRYRRAAPVQRTQMRWVLAAVALGAATGVATLGVAEGLGDLWVISTMLPVLAIAIAITRYHLYDIDRIVSRSIGYAVVSLVLFSAFAGLALLMQSLISGVIAEPGSELDPRVVAASTLAVAALFNPLRTRVQRTVDRRFHRARYDAERTVGGFAGRLRDNLDLPTLTSELRRTTVETVEPTATGIWLRTSTASS